MPSPGFLHQPLADDLHPMILDPILNAVLREDLGWGDLTSSAIIEAGCQASAEVVLHQDGVCCGLRVVERVFHLLDPAIAVVPLAAEGSWVEAQTTIAHVKGPARAILSGERVALNILQRMCAVATLTRRFVEKLGATRTQLLDTRKTTPGLRLLERQAVRIGGGRNHRFCLSDAVLIKDNHIAMAGSIAEAVRRVRLVAPAMAKIEVETETLFQVQEALDSGVDVIMLDNMPISDLEQAIALIGGRVPTEASGGITLEQVGAVARTGVDFISTGAITRLAGFLDISLQVHP